MVEGPGRTTRYFEEQVRAKRPYVTSTLCAEAVSRTVHRELQPDGRVRLWGWVTLPGEEASRILRVVLLDDGETLHNAFLDRSFR